jgi:hypothetical protein
VCADVIDEPRRKKNLLANIVKALAQEHPEWKDKESFASLLKGDLNRALAGGEKASIEIVAATHAA